MSRFADEPELTNSACWRPSHRAHPASNSSASGPSASHGFVFSHSGRSESPAHCAVVARQREQAGVGEMFGVADLPARSPSAPDNNGPAVLLGLVELADQRRKDVGTL